MLGLSLGINVGEVEGPRVGSSDGAVLGAVEGSVEGLLVGRVVGADEGDVDGSVLGLVEGADVGDVEGDWVGVRGRMAPRTPARRGSSRLVPLGLTVNMRSLRLARRSATSRCCQF